MCSSDLDKQDIIYQAKAFVWVYRRAQDKSPITENDIGMIHTFICGHGDDGVCHISYRDSDVKHEAGFSSNCEPLTVEDHILIPKSMEKLINLLNSSLDVHPVERASYAHYHLLKIHPFDSKNSQTAFLVMNLLLLQNGYPCVLLSAQDRLRYVESIEEVRQEKYQKGDQILFDGVERGFDIIFDLLSDFSVSE